MGVYITMVSVGLVCCEGIDWRKGLLIVIELKVLLVEVAHVLFAVLFGEGIVGIVLQIVVCMEIWGSLLCLLMDHDSL